LTQCFRHWDRSFYEGARGLGKLEFLKLAERIAEAEGWTGKADLLATDRTPLGERAAARRRGGGLAARDEAVAAQFAAASRRAFRSLITRVMEEGAAFLIIAGDVFDGDWRDYSTGLFFTREIARLGRAGIPTYVVRGNHDAESQITRRLDRPQGLHVFDARRAESLELPEIGVVLHGRSFGTAAESDSLVRSYPEAHPGCFNVGVLHTSLDGREGHARYAPTSIAELAARGYDYWALGHVHAYEEVSREPWIVFPGNLQGRNVRETGPKGAVLVEVGDDLRVARVGRLVLDEARWATLVADLSGIDNRDAAIESIRNALDAEIASAEGRPLAVRVTLRGTTTLHRAFAADPAELAAAVENAALGLSEAVWIERVVLATHMPQAPVRPATDGLADVVALLGEVAAESQVLNERVAAALRPLSSKLPPTLIAELNDHAGLIAEARDLLLGRLVPSTGAS
jgi:DNA repair exonuclease SbcCD nuclease subunit